LLYNILSFMEKKFEKFKFQMSLNNLKLVKHLKKFYHVYKIKKLIFYEKFEVPQVTYKIISLLKSTK